MTLSSSQILIIIAVMTLATMITRFLPFIIFNKQTGNNSYIDYLGDMLPYAAIGLLVVYCLRNVNFKSPANVLSELIAVSFIVLIHYLKENTLLSIGLGTALYMFLVQFIFV